MPLDPAPVGTEAGLDDVSGSFGAAASGPALDVGVHEPLAPGRTNPCWETVDAGVVELDIIPSGDARTTRINPPGGGGGFTAVSQLLPVVRLIKSTGPILGSLF
ncbi:hypothetical protein PV327_010001 [Microctonus hyperodae]|uniref:Uncharacterized protein n=1 Tax=Microctonus hyperodae TaxID=165561 RepID=A0AA39F257_MICHY|nr:hypothetical protein PV327_010001 [Microctonus hyperodae]